MFFATFKKWNTLVKNETRSKVKCLKFDNGIKYGRKEFNNYSTYNGHHRERKTPKAREEKGLLEIMNIIVMEHASNMRLHAPLPLQFWAKRVTITTY